MGTSENFCLRWNDFESSVSGSFKELREQSDFLDVTLAAGDGQGCTLRAHRVVLSACSPLMRRLLRELSSAAASSSPLLYLRGVRHRDLERILDFMYQGEVYVAQAELKEFLTVAEELQVKGLTQEDSSPKKRSSCRSSSSSPRPGFSSKKRKKEVEVGVKEEEKVLVAHDEAAEYEDSYGYDDEDTGPLADQGAVDGAKGMNQQLIASNYLILST